MSKKRICFTAQFPPPMHGLSKAVETLYNSELQAEYDFEKVDITNNKIFLKNILTISRSKAELFYFTISQTKGGNLRDLVIFKLLSMQHKKCLVHLHGGYYRKLVDNDVNAWQRRAIYKVISKLEGVIVLGESLKSIFQGMISDEKIFVVPNCVDNEYLMSNEEFEEKIAELNKRSVRHVFYLSNFIRSKGYPEVLEMAKLEKQRVESGGKRSLHFNFAGKFFEESEQSFFFDYIKKYNLNDYVTYHGIVDGDKKRELLKMCDIFILLTRYPNEGQPISILEAMGNGMMIVTTDHAGIPDIVKDGVNGIVVSKEDQVVDRVYNSLIYTGVRELKQIEVLNRSQCNKNYSESHYLSALKEIFKNK